MQNMTSCPSIPALFMAAPIRFCTSREKKKTSILTFRDVRCKGQGENKQS